MHPNQVLPSSGVGKKHWLFSNDQLLLVQKQDGFQIPDFAEMMQNLAYQFRLNAIGPHQGYDCFVSEIPQEFKEQFSSPYEWVTLRQALDLLSEQWFPITARAFQILAWDKNHQHCGCCAKPTIKLSTQFERRCEICKISYFPKISPSIIVLIKKGHQILMARSPFFSPGVYALIAGFVEPGETLEQAVHREVHEEVGLRIQNLRYYGSQPWPFPDSLMVAFVADYVAGEICFNDQELEAAGWYDAEHLPGLPSFSLSIAWTLINDFRAGKL